MASEVTVLLMLEAIDKASKVIEGITGKLDGLGEKAADAAAKASMTGEELEAAQVKAEAAANAYTVAVQEQEAAQARLLTSTRAVRDAQAAAADAARAESAAQEAAAAALGASADEMIVKYSQLADAAAADASAAEASAAKITDLETKLASVHGAAADAVQGALDREMASYQALAASAQESAAAVTAAFSEADAKILAGYQEQAVAAREAAASAKAASAEQIAALDGLSAAQRTATKRSAEMAAAEDAANTSVVKSGAGLKGATVAAGLTAAAVAGIGYESVKAAANFQQATTVLQTSGGETAAQMAAVRAGILSIASSTGTEIQELTNGMYMIGSAGFTGAKGLTVLTAAAQGAKAENADLGTVSNALTTILKDYGLGADRATASMDQLIAVVQNGKTTTEALAASLSNVLPIASAAGLSFEQVGGAMATMTGEGMSAQQAAQDLANSIRSLQNPNNVAINEMAQMGLNANQVSQQLGKKGLTGTLEELTSAIAQHMGPSGQVIMSTFQQAKAAASDANQEIAAMPANLQKLATSFLNGSVTAKQWRTDLQGLDPVSAHLLTQFAGTAEKAHSFNSLLTSGSPAAQTYTAALSKMLGGATGLNTALMLTGANTATFQSNVKAVGDAGKTAGQNVNGWAEIQGNLNQKLSELKQTAEAAGIQLGTALLPMVTKILDMVLKVVGPIANWIEHNKTLAAMILLVVGALATGVTVFILAAKAIDLIRGAMVTFGEVTEGLEFNPVILAVTALALAAVLIVTHWSTVKRWLGDFWSWLKSAFDDAVAFVKGHVHEIAAGLVVLLGPIGLLIAAVLEIATHWRQVEAVLKDVWNWMKGAAKDVGDAVSGAFRTAVAVAEGVWADFVGVLKAVWGGLSAAWDATGGKVVTAISRAWDQASAAVSKEWDKISADLSSIWQSLVTIWNATGGKLVSLISSNWDTIVALFEGAVQDVEDVVEPPLNFMIEAFETAFGVVESLTKTAWNFIVGIFRVELGLVETVLKAGWQAIEGAFRLAWDLVSTIVRAAWSVISGIVRAQLDIVEGIIKAAWDVVLGIVRAAWAGITATINVALDLIKGFFQFFADLVTGKWGKLWGDVKSTVSAVWQDIYSFFKSILGDIEKTVVGSVSSIFGGFEKAIKDALSGVTGAFKTIYNGIIGFFKDAGSWLYDIGKTILTGLISGAKSALGDVKSFFGGIASDIISWKGPPSYDAVMLTDNGQLIMKGLITGFDDQVPALHAKLGSISASIKADMTGPQNLGQAFASGLGGAASLGTTSATSGPTIIIEGGNTLMTDADFDKFAQKVGSRVVTSIGAQGGVKTLLR